MELTMTYEELKKLNEVLNLSELIAVELILGKEKTVDVDYLDSLNSKAIEILDEMVPRPLPTRLEFNEGKDP